MTSRRRLAPSVAALSLVLTGLVVVSPPASSAEAIVLAIEGRGWGHGVGMAQDGALAMGRAGTDTPAIIDQFYPGTTISASGTGVVRVAVHNSGGRTEVLGFPDGGEIRANHSGAQPAGFPVVVPAGGTAEVSFDGSVYRARALGRETAAGGSQELHLPVQLISSTTDTTPPNRTRATWLSTSTTVPPLGSGGIPAPVSPGVAPAPGGGGPTAPGGSAPPGGAAPSPAAPSPGGPAPAPGVAPPPAPEPPAPPAETPAGVAAAGTLWAVPNPGGTTLVTGRDRRYRGEIEIIASGAAGNLRLVNRVDVEDYLRGMGEVRDPSWPAASLRAQAIAARTYALRSVKAGSEICDYDLCQVYLGQRVEYPEMDRAVADTRGQVIQFQGALATAVYSANAGGTTATPQEGWGGGAAGAPYLRSAPYPTGDPMSWTVEVAFHDLAARFGYPGTVTGARVSSAGPSGRALEVLLEGDAGDRPIEGTVFAAKLSLRSNLFTFRTAQVEVLPPPPPDGASFLQQLPGGEPATSLVTTGVEPPLRPLASARVAGSLPVADRLGLSGVAALATLIAGLGLHRRRQSGRLQSAVSR